MIIDLLKTSYEFFCGLQINSIKCGLLIAVVLLLRFLFKKAPFSARFVLWGIVFIRLMIPINIESGLSVYNYMPYKGVLNISQEINSEVADSFAGDILPENMPYNLNGYIGLNISNIYNILFVVWIIGMTLLAGCSIIKYLRLRNVTCISVLYKDNVFLCDEVKSPFIMGLFKSKIFLPSGIDEQNIEYVLAHEYAHIKRKDNWWKFIGCFVLCIHWMNPLVWISYRLFCKDIELSCDEKVIKKCDFEYRKAYSKALLECSMQKKMIFANPLAFGENGVKERIYMILNYKKPAILSGAALVMLCVIISAVFITEAKSGAINVNGTDVVQNVDISEDNSPSNYNDNYKIPEELLECSFDNCIVEPRAYTFDGYTLYFEYDVAGEKSAVSEITIESADPAFDTVYYSMSGTEETSIMRAIIRLADYHSETDIVLSSKNGSESYEFHIWQNAEKAVYTDHFSDDNETE